jgi:hypothetical protein
MFQFPRCPPRSPWVPGRAPGGLPHSDIPGSQAASASPGHFAAWPRPSSAANAKASTMRPSCGCPAPRPLRSPSSARPQTGARQRDGPVRQRRSARGAASAVPRWAWCSLSRVLRVCCVLQCARASRHEPSGAVPSPAAAEPSGFRVAHCQGASRPEGRPTTVVVARRERLGGRQTSSEVVPRPRTNSPNLVWSVDHCWRDDGAALGSPGGAAGIRTPDLRRARAALSQLSYGPVRPPPVPRVGAPGLEPGTSALSGPRSNRLSYAPAARAVFPSSTAVGGSGFPRRASRPMPKTERAETRLHPTTVQCQRSARGAADLPAIRGAPARPYHRLATGEPRGSVPTDAGSPLGDLTRVSSQLAATP